MIRDSLKHDFRFIRVISNGVRKIFEADAQTI